MILTKKGSKWCSACKQVQSCGRSAWPPSRPDPWMGLSLHRKNCRSLKADGETQRDRQRGESDLRRLGRRSISCNHIMKAALSSSSCFLSCLGHSPGDMSSEHGGSPLSLQTQGHHSASAAPQTLCRMSEGDVTVLPFGPASLDLSKQEYHALTRLYSQNGGYHLRILPDGSVSGGRLENDPYDVLRLKAVSAGVVVIRGEMTGRYLAMNRNGRLYGSQALSDECYFLEKYEENHYNTYRSQKYDWYVALKRNGQPKAGPDTHQGQKAVFFLPRSAGNV